MMGDLAVLLKTCTGPCGEAKPLDEFHFKTKAHTTRRAECITCHNARQKAWTQRTPEEREKKVQRQRDDEGRPDKCHAWYRDHWLRCALKTAARRASEKGVPFALEEKDVVVPVFCPILGVRLQIQRGKHSDDSPSLDRVIPSLGYVPGNVIVISHRGNTIKSNATLEELEALTRWLRARRAEQ